MTLETALDNFAAAVEARAATDMAVKNATNAAKPFFHTLLSKLEAEVLSARQNVRVAARNSN